MAVRAGIRDVDALARVMEAVRPVSLAADHVLPVHPVIAGLLPQGGLQRGSLVAVQGSAARSFAFSLVSAALQGDSWLAIVGVPSLGWRSAAGFGLPLDRIVQITAEGPDLLMATGTALDGFDLVLVGDVPDLYRVQARARERGAVIVVLGASNRTCDVVLDASLVRWDGLFNGAGRLAARQVAITASGRRSAARAQRARLWLPDAEGRLRHVDPDESPGEVLSFDKARTGRG
jgi:hypothetical protein